MIDVPRPTHGGAHERVKIRGLEPNRLYYFAVKAVDDNGNWSDLSNVVGKTSPDPETTPSLFELALAAPAPNPARTRTIVELSLPRDTDIHVDVLDVTGRIVKTLAAGLYPAGVTPIYWDLRDRWGRALSAGCYWVAGRLGSRRIVRQLTVVP